MVGLALTLVVLVLGAALVAAGFAATFFSSVPVL